MALRLFKTFKDLLDAPAPSTGKFLSWDASGNLVNADVASLPTDPSFNSLTLTQVSGANALTLTQGARIKLGSASQYFYADAAYAFRVSGNSRIDGSLIATAFHTTSIATSNAGGSGIAYMGGAVSSGTAISHKFFNFGSLTTAGDKLISIYSDNNATERAYIDHLGGYTAKGTFASIATGSGGAFIAAASNTLNLTANAPSTGTAVGTILNNTQTLVNGDKLLSVRNNGTEQAYIDYQGKASFSGLIGTPVAVSNISATGTPDGTTYLRGDGTWAAPTASIPDATAAVTGGIKLTGDLGGTAASPTVPGLAGKANTSHTHGLADFTATGTPSATTYLRGDNTWSELTGVISKVSASNITNSTTTPTNITGLSFSIAAGEVKGFHAVIIHQGTATSGPRFNVKGPASPTTVAIHYHRGTSATADTISTDTAFSTSAQTAAITSGGNTGILVTEVYGTVINGSNAGTVQFQLTSSTSGQTVTVYRGSHIELT